MVRMTDTAIDVAMGLSKQELARRLVETDQALEAALERAPRLLVDIANRQEVLDRIWEVVHTPTPGRMGAAEHYQRDFDEIRRLVGPFIQKG